MDIPIRHRLSVRVVLGSTVLLLIFFGSFSYVAIRFYNEQTMQQVLNSASRMSDVIKQSMHYSMLLNRREDVYQIITMIGTEPGVEGIRIYNKRGEIMFSTDKSEERSVVNMHAEACFACHDKEKPLGSLPIGNRTRIYSGNNHHRILGLINPIRNEPGCSNADCHAHPPEQTVLGVLDVRMSVADVDMNMARAENTMIAFALGMSVIIGIIAVMYLSQTVTRPVRRLAEGAREISTGNLDRTIVIRTKNELGQLAHAFNEMTTSLRHEKEENRRWAETLEEKIDEKTKELKAIHRQILHIEKMTSLGKLSATVAHELNNPLEGILTLSKLTERRLKKNSLTPESIRQTLDDVGLIAHEADRCGKIVKNLLLFSKKNVGEFALVPLKQIVDKAAALIQHHCQISNVQFCARYDNADISLICDENQIQQALVALFVNAVEAIPEGGTITLAASMLAEDDALSICITDTGIGIAAETVSHIFEPFFTTKENGKGVGLGLSVVYGIVQRHGGRITVDSAMGKGTSFTIILPRVPKPEELNLERRGSEPDPRAV